jgi:hypothetical protein
MLGRILSPASAQVVSLSCNAGYFGETNAVDYNGRVYRTLDGASPLDARTNYLCQNYYLPLPSGWALAADNADSTNVIGRHRWGTSHMVVANGNAYYTANCGHSTCAGVFTEMTVLYNSSSTYALAYCRPGQGPLILIVKDGSACTACPGGESEIAGREFGKKQE